jgi:hypothetical protein
MISGVRGGSITLGDQGKILGKDSGASPPIDLLAGSRIDSTKKAPPDAPFTTQQNETWPKLIRSPIETPQSTTLRAKPKRTSPLSEIGQLRSMQLVVLWPVSIRSATVVLRFTIVQMSILEGQPPLDLNGQSNYTDASKSTSFK